MTLVAGSYERFLWGYKLKPAPTPTLTPLFSYAAHLSPIKSATIAGPLAASSAGDDTIKLYDLTTSSELGSLLHYTTFTSLSFFTPHHYLSFPRNLLAAADDGALFIFDVDPFVLLDSVPVHKKSVNDLTVHPSGRVALTVGRDSCLGMVNLVRGKRSFCCRLKEEGVFVEYCVGGGRFYMGSDTRVSVHDSEDAKIVAEFVASKRVLCAACAENGLILSGGEDRGITAWDTLSGKVAYNIENAHQSRVKGIVVLTRDQNVGDAEDPFLVASASSDGVIRVWDVRMTNKEKSKPLSEADTKSRLTCLAGSSIKAFSSQTAKTDSSVEEAAAMEDS